MSLICWLFGHKEMEFTSKVDFQLQVASGIFAVPKVCKNCLKIYWVIK